MQIKMINKTNNFFYVFGPDKWKRFRLSSRGGGGGGGGWIELWKIFPNLNFWK